ncbi:ATP-binding protein [uncultured Algimonas sp.]|uniref:ATP-binding protein n=1 Tax=uncultured Algimonas sp. TaxID=1547920 RepID=UPI00261D5F65|nr:ATP-binding protein [uncultured Algimonas sp.]
MIPNHMGQGQAAVPAGNVQRSVAQVEIGRIVTVGSSEAVISINKSLIRDGRLQLAQIGTILKILTSASIVVAMVTSLEIEAVDDEGMSDGCLARMSILGEITTNPTTRQTKFFRGVRTFPVLNEPVYTMSPADLQLIFSKENVPTIEIGRMQQDPSIVARVRTDDMLSKHFAIIGSTGSGKSCAVALILQAVLQTNPAGHIVLFDPHNEYSRSFGRWAEVITGETLDLPLWMFDFVETVALLTSEIEDHSREEEEILNDVILTAKRLYDRSLQSGDVSAQVKLDDLEAELQRATHITLDSPVPYRIHDVLKILNHEMGKLENNSNLQPYKRLNRRIATLMGDPRYAFIFRNQAMPRPIDEIVGRIFRLPVNGKPISILDFSSIPSEMLNIVVSVVSRLAFEVAMWSNRKIPILLVCEEAHRYIPRDPSQGFHATRRIISRIAKEGRKYGVSLGIISQRPSELEPSTLSQCSTVFSMRLSNEVDQNFVKAAVPEGAADLLDFLPSLGTAEAMVFGEAVNMPMRVLLNTLAEKYRPHSSSASFTGLWSKDQATPDMMKSVYARWRSKTPIAAASRGAGSPAMPPQTTLAQKVAAAPSLQKDVKRRNTTDFEAIRSQLRAAAPETGKDDPRSVKQKLNDAFHRNN